MINFIPWPGVAFATPTGHGLQETPGLPQLLYRHPNAGTQPGNLRGMCKLPIQLGATSAALAAAAAARIEVWWTHMPLGKRPRGAPSRKSQVCTLPLAELAALDDGEERRFSLAVANVADADPISQVLEPSVDVVGKRAGPDVTVSLLCTGKRCQDDPTGAVEMRIVVSTRSDPTEPARWQLVCSHEVIARSKVPKVFNKKGARNPRNEVLWPECEARRALSNGILTPAAPAAASSQQHVPQPPPAALSFALLPPFSPASLRADTDSARDSEDLNFWLEVADLLAADVRALPGLQDFPSGEGEEDTPQVVVGDAGFGDHQRNAAAHVAVASAAIAGAAEACDEQEEQCADAPAGGNGAAEGALKRGVKRPRDSETQVKEGGRLRHGLGDASLGEQVDELGRLLFY